MKVSFREKWKKELKKLGMHVSDKQAEEDILKGLEEMKSDEERSAFLASLYHSPQARRERFGCIMWIVIIIGIILFFLMRRNL
jgi:hypothetical protein